MEAEIEDHSISVCGPILNPVLKLRRPCCSWLRMGLEKLTAQLAPQSAGFKGLVQDLGFRELASACRVLAQGSVYSRNLGF